MTLMAIMAKMAYMATSERHFGNLGKSRGRKHQHAMAQKTSRGGTREVDIDLVTATVAKNEFGRVLESVIKGHKVFITKHDAPKAVLISIDEFEVLSSSTKSKLDTLDREFDQLLARMQLPGARTRMKSAFEARPEDLGKAAVKAASKRG